MLLHKTTIIISLSLVFILSITTLEDGHESTSLSDLIEDIITKHHFQNLIFINLNERITDFPKMIFSSLEDLTLKQVTSNSLFVVLLSNNKSENKDTLQTISSNKVLFVVEGGQEQELWLNYIFELYPEALKLKTLVVFGSSPAIWYSSHVSFDFPQENYFPKAMDLIKAETLNFYISNKTKDFLYFEYYNQLTRKPKCGGLLCYFFKVFGSRMNISVEFKNSEEKNQTNNGHELFYKEDITKSMKPSAVIEYFTSSFGYRPGTVISRGTFFTAAFDFYSWLSIVLMILSFNVYYTVASRDFDVINTLLNSIKFYLGQGVRMPAKRSMIFKLFVVVGFIVNTMYVNLFGYFSKVGVINFDGWQRDSGLVLNMKFYDKSMTVEPGALYYLGYYDWEILDEMHRHKKSFDLIRVNKSWPSKAMFDLSGQDKFHLEVELNAFILDVYSFGLMQWWKRVSVKDISRTNRLLYQVLDEDSPEIQINDNLDAIFMLMLYGLLASFIAFGVEVCFEYFEWLLRILFSKIKICL